jgi:hypothetical protein
MEYFAIENQGLPNTFTDWHYATAPSLTWIITMGVGLLVTANGFLGFWLSERKRKISRVILHCISHVCL